MVYCWRGGQRSRSLAIILKEIGFQPTVVRGGYKEYRRMVRSSLFDLSPAATLASRTGAESAKRRRPSTIAEQPGKVMTMI